MHKNAGVTNRKVILAGFLAGISVAIIIFSRGAAQEKEPAPKPDAQKEIDAAEDLPPTAAFYSFKPLETDALPERLIIPSLSIDAPVREVGLTSDGSLDVVRSYTEVGWYKDGAYPGAVGNAVIEGHFDTDDRAHPQAIFFYLNQLAPGEEVDIIDAESRILKFAVAEVRRYPYDVKPSEIFGPSSESRLNLITCNGRWIKEKRVYDERLVVVTKRMP